MDMQAGVESLGIDDQLEDKTKSVLEVQDLDDFLHQAEMANREFSSEKEGLVVLDAAGQLYKPTTVQWADQKSDFTFKELSVPRRPEWDETTTPQELEENERNSFLDWRRAIAHREEELMRAQTSAAVTPFEKNLEVWRQLWRVMERSSCLMQLVDARNPLFYLSDDLRDYATSLGKPMMVLVNKSDYLSENQRIAWRDYLQDRGWDPLFFSAFTEQEKLDKAAQRKRRQEADAGPVLPNEDGEDMYGNSDEEDEESEPLVSTDGRGVDVPLNRQQLMDTMLKFARQNGCQPDPRHDNRIQFGLCGFPNVGKSSVINVLVGSSKHTHGLVRVGVAAQPGKTKHFQTLMLPDSDEMMLCDCPGLVFPSFVSNTADLIAAGVYPIAQMRDHWPVTNLICQRIPREILNAQYGIHCPVPTEQEMREKGLTKIPPPTGEEFLSTLCVARGMLAASSGIPDYTRASRMIIKDYASGKLLYCHAPPSADVTAFHRETAETALERTKKLKEKLEKQGELAIKMDTEEGDDSIAEADLAAAEAAVDDDLLAMLGGTPSQNKAAVSQQPSRRSKKKGGRKSKNRSDDPYGCHSSPDDILDQTGAVKGVGVKGGKYGKKGYTRPTGYGFATPAVK